MRCGSVNSGKRTDGGMNDLKFAASGLVGRAPTISGYSCSVSTVATGGDLSEKFDKAQACFFVATALWAM